MPATPRNAPSSSPRSRHQSRSTAEPPVLAKSSNKKQNAASHLPSASSKRPPASSRAAPASVLDSYLLALHRRRELRAVRTRFLRPSPTTAISDSTTTTTAAAMPSATSGVYGPNRVVEAANYAITYRELPDTGAVADGRGLDEEETPQGKKRRASSIAGALQAYDLIRDFIPDQPIHHDHHSLKAKGSGTGAAAAGTSTTTGTTSAALAAATKESLKEEDEGEDGAGEPTPLGGSANGGGGAARPPAAPATMGSSARAYIPRKLRVNRTALHAPPAPVPVAAGSQGMTRSPSKRDDVNGTTSTLERRQSRMVATTRLREQHTLDSVLMSNFDLSSEQQAVAIAWMLEEVGALACLPDITSEDLIHFVRSVQVNYNTPPFHNFAHAFCVTQIGFIILKETGLIDELSEAVSTMLIIACLCHDIDHEGLTNMYHVNTESTLATMYNDTCPMENHHAGLTMALLKSRHSILRNLEPSEAKHFRQVITQLILATDMGKHDQVLAQGLRLVGTKLSVADPAHLTVLLQTILKAADLSNELRPAPVADAWSGNLYEELNREMKQLRRPLNPVDTATVSRSQVDFLRTKVLPIWTMLNDLIAPRSAATLVNRVKDAISRHEVRVLAATAAASVKGAPTVLTNPMRSGIVTKFNPAEPSLPAGQGAPASGSGGGSGGGAREGQPAVRFAAGAIDQSPEEKATGLVSLNRRRTSTVNHNHRM
ncbi:3',5'-cyclic-nucleotide phosphodiesterase [Blastocladiella emersonii ATCC 22665]|nr:3',5'-cyclic-nucleotide phosphodiesterase [Blastocladiella emersonii ATCC 22665]